MSEPLDNSQEARRAKHQALKASQMLHLRSGKRYAGRKKVIGAMKHGEFGSWSVLVAKSLTLNAYQMELGCQSHCCNSELPAEVTSGSP